jgi:chromosome segregation ATPase
METLKRDNSILASQLRDMQEEMVESSNVSRFQSKNVTSLEISNSILNERISHLEKENKEYEEKLMSLTDGQAHLDSHSASKLKAKISKLKDSLNQKTLRVSEYESEIFRLSQVLSDKDQELSSFVNQYQELKNSCEEELRQKDSIFLEKIKSKFKS